MKGMQTFMVKHIETQFNLPASDAALHTGIMVIIGTYVGLFVCYTLTQDPWSGFLKVGLAKVGPCRWEN